MNSAMEPTSSAERLGQDYSMESTTSGDAHEKLQGIKDSNQLQNIAIDIREFADMCPATYEASKPVSVHIIEHRLGSFTEPITELPLEINMKIFSLLYTWDRYEPKWHQALFAPPHVGAVADEWVDRIFRQMTVSVAWFKLALETFLSQNIFQIAAYEYLVDFERLLRTTQMAAYRHRVQHLRITDGREMDEFSLADIVRVLSLHGLRSILIELSCDITDTDWQVKHFGINYLELNRARELPLLAQAFKASILKGKVKAFLVVENSGERQTLRWLAKRFERLGDVQVERLRRSDKNWFHIADMYSPGANLGGRWY